MPILSAQKRKVNSQATIHRLPKPRQQKIRTTFPGLMGLHLSCNRWSDNSNGRLRIWCKHASILPVSTIQAVAGVVWGPLSCSRLALVIYYLFSILQDQKHPRGDFWIQIQMISLTELVKWLYKKLCLLINTNSDEQCSMVLFMPWQTEALMYGIKKEDLTVSALKVPDVATEKVWGWLRKWYC